MFALSFTPWLGIALLYVRLQIAAAIGRWAATYRARNEHQSAPATFVIPANDCCAP